MVGRQIILCTFQESSLQVHQCTILCTLLMPNLEHHNRRLAKHFKQSKNNNSSTNILSVTFCYRPKWYWSERKAAPCFMDELQCTQIHKHEDKGKIMINFMSKYLSADDHSYVKLTSNSLTILMTDCSDCAACFSFTNPSFFSSSS